MLDGSALALSEQAWAQSGACSTKSAATVVISQMYRLTRFANRMVLRTPYSLSHYRPIRSMS
jgi:hypothetical protein